MKYSFLMYVLITRNCYLPHLVKYLLAKLSVACHACDSKCEVPVHREASRPDGTGGSGGEDINKSTSINNKAISIDNKSSYNTLISDVSISHHEHCEEHQSLVAAGDGDEGGAGHRLCSAWFALIAGLGIDEVQNSLPFYACMSLLHTTKNAN